MREITENLGNALAPLEGETYYDYLKDMIIRLAKKNPVFLKNLRVALEDGTTFKKDPILANPNSNAQYNLEERAVLITKEPILNAMQSGGYAQGALERDLVHEMGHAEHNAFLIKGGERIYTYFSRGLSNLQTVNAARETARCVLETDMQGLNTSKLADVGALVYGQETPPIAYFPDSFKDPMFCLTKERLEFANTYVQYHKDTIGLPQIIKYELSCYHGESYDLSPIGPGETPQIFSFVNNQGRPLVEEEVSTNMRSAWKALTPQQRATLNLVLTVADSSYDYEEHFPPGTTCETCQDFFEKFLRDVGECLQNSRSLGNDPLVNAREITRCDPSDLPSPSCKTALVESYTSLLEHENTASATLVEVSAEQMEGLCSRELQKAPKPKVKTPTEKSVQPATSFGMMENFLLFFIRGFVAEACKRKRVSKPGEWAIRTTGYVGLLNASSHSFEEIAAIIGVFSLMDTVEALIGKSKMGRVVVGILMIAMITMPYWLGEESATETASSFFGNACVTGLAVFSSQVMAAKMVPTTPKRKLPKALKHAHFKKT